MDWLDLPRGRPAARLLLLLCICPANGCAVADYFTVQDAEQDMPGLSADDLRLCAGLPERTTRAADGREFWSYERTTTASTGTVSFAGFGINIAGGQECRATFELAGDRVSRMAFTRVSSASACAPLVQTCASLVGQHRIAPETPAQPGPEAPSSRPVDAHVSGG